MSIEVKYKGLDKLNRQLDKMKAALKSNPKLKIDIGQYLERDIKKIFMQGGDPQWTPSNRARKGKIAIRGSRKGQRIAGKTLMQTGRLRNSIKSRVQGDHIYIGTNVKYAKIHHFGGNIKNPGGQPFLATDSGVIFLKKDGSYPKGVRYTNPYMIKIPARPFLMVRPSAFKHIKVMISQSLKVQ